MSRIFKIYLVEKSEYFSTFVFFSCSFLVNDSYTCGKNDVSELSWWEKVGNNFFVIFCGDIKSWWDDSAFINSSKEFNNDFSSSSVINDFEISDIV